MAPFQVAGRLPILRSEVIFEVREAMRVVGKRKMPLPGQNGPSEADVLASQEIAMAAPRTAPKGVYRYRSHDEANRDAERWLIDAMVERNLELADRSGDGPKLR
jgi:hypothetical protein